MAATPATIGSYCGFALAAATVALAATYLLLPARIGDVLGALFRAYSQPGLYQLFFGLWALTGLLGLAVVAPATQLFVARGDGWSDWAAKLAYLGYAVTAVQGVHLFATVPGLAQLYQGCGTCTAGLADQQTIAKWLYVTQPLDSLNWLILGAVGIWILAVSVIGLASGGAHRGALYLGVAAGVLFLVVVVGQAFDLPVDAVIGLGAVVAAVWYGWVAVLLRRMP